MNPKEIESVKKALNADIERIRVLELFPTPLPWPAAALMIWQESRWMSRCVHVNYGQRKDLITGKMVVDKTRGFWEIGSTQRTVSIVDGTGTARGSGVNPWDLASSVFGLQDECQGNMNGWRSEFAANHVSAYFPLPSEVDSWLILMRLPYSVGWAEARALLEAGGAYRGKRIEEALRVCLKLPDVLLPDIGPQTDEKIRKRIRNLLQFPIDARKVGPLPDRIGGFPVRTPFVLPFPEWWSIIRMAEQIRKESKS